MEQEKVDMLIKLLEETSLHVVESGDQRVYVSSSTYGNARYHLLDQVLGSAGELIGVQLLQLDRDEKWSKRLDFATDELPSVIKTLALWYLSEEQRCAAPDENPF